MKNSKKAPQWISIENDCTENLLIPHCPFCGTKALDEEKGEFRPCQHLQFAWVGAIGEFGFTSPDFSQRSAAAEDLEFGLEKEHLEACGYQDELLVYEVTNSGMACGPVSYTDVYGYVQESGAEE